MAADNNTILALENPKAGSPQRIKREVVNQAEIEKLAKSPKFRSKLLISPRTNRPYFYFRYHGQVLQGFLGDVVFDNSGIQRSRSFLMITDDGHREEFFANQRLAKIITHERLWGKYVEITYIGDEYTGYGHARKIYQVVKVSGVTDNVGFMKLTEPSKKLKGKSDERSVPKQSAKK